MSRKLQLLLVVFAIALVAAVLWPREVERPGFEQRSAVAARSVAAIGVRPGDSPAQTTGQALPFAEREPEPPVERDGAVLVRVSARGRPLALAEVRLYSRGPIDLSTAKVEWRRAGSGVTDADGKLRLFAKPGVYLAAARVQGLAPARREFVRPAGEAESVVALELSPGSSLRGRTVAKGAKKSAAAASAGSAASAPEAVPLAALTLTYVATTSAARPLAAPPDEETTANSDARGEFRFEGLAPGRYRLEAKAPGLASARLLDLLVPRAQELVVELFAASFIEGHVYGPDGRPAKGAEVSAVGAEEETSSALTDGSGSFSLEVAPRLYHLAARRGHEAGASEAPVAVAAGATARGVKIVLGASGGVAGNVVSASAHKPVAGALISVSPHNDNGDSGRATSDEAGNFAVLGLAPGIYDVDTVAAGWVAEQRRGLVVGAGARFALHLELHATGSASGFVRDASGRGVAGAVVRGAAGSTVGVASEARTDGSGAYTLGGLSSGRAQLSARRDGSLAGQAATLEIPEGFAASHDFTLPDEGTLAGRVTRSSGAPLEKVVLLRAFPGAGRGGITGPDDVLIPVDASGAFSISLPAGPYNLMASYSPTSPSVHALVTIEPGQTELKDLLLSDPPEGPPGISGQVLEADGTPSPLAQVAFFSQARGWMIAAESADESGQFQLDRPRADLPDSFEVQAQSRGRMGVANVGPGETQVVVKLLSGSTLRGHLRSSGAPVETFTVTYRILGRSFGGGAQSLDFAGETFELQDLPPGALELSIQTRDGRSGEGEVTIRTGEPAQLDVTLSVSASVSGRLIDSETRQPVAGAYLALDDTRSDTESGPDGRFTLGGLVPGEHVASFFASNYVGASRTFTLAAGQSFDLGEVGLNKQKLAPGTIGVQLRGDSNGVLVAWLSPDGPADHAGIRLGDTISAVDGQPVQGVDDARVRIRGTPGTPVVLTLNHSGSQRTIQVVRSS